MPAIPFPVEIVAGFETVMNVAGAIAATAALILAVLILHAYHDDERDRGRSLTSYTLGLGTAVLAALVVSIVLNQWAYFIFAFLALPVAFGARWAIVRFLDRRF
ncbi:hypothetical protein D7252_19785 [Microbacterium sp. CGR2]|nr:hypothetical protein D7252_19785 [Microbacterium sp. CGR2]